MRKSSLSRGLVFLCIATVCIISLVGGDEDSGFHNRAKRTVNRSRSRSRSRLGPNSNQLRGLLRRFGGGEAALRNIDLSDLRQYTPTTPRPEDVNCQVEIPMTTLVGGRCISLGTGSSMVCQAGEHVAFTSDCSNANSATTDSASP